MINQAYLDDKKIKDILTYVSGMRHSEQIRMMFFCSLNGMRSINFCYLQIKDVFNADETVKDVICLDADKNKGKFGANYYLNSQIKKEFREYLKFLKSQNGELTPENATEAEKLSVAFFYSAFFLRIEFTILSIFP